MRTLLAAALLALAACHPSLPDPGTGDDTAVPPDARIPDAEIPDVEPPPPPPIEPPGTAMETVSAAGHLTRGADTFDVQLGGVSRATSATPDATLDTAPVLH